MPSVVEKLATLGYQHEGNLGVEGREAFRYENKTDLMLHHLYVCPKTSNELRRHLAFRDYLRSHPDAVEKYASIKQQGAKQFPTDIDSYISFKSEFVESIYRKCGL